MPRLLLSVLAAAAFVLFAAAAPARAEMQKITSHDVPAAESYVQNLANEVMAVLNSGQSEQAKEQRIRQMIDADLDAEAIAKYTLGSLWRQATPAEFEQFVGLLRDYASSFYEGQLNKYAGARLTVTGSAASGAKAVVVGSTIDKLKDNEPIQIDWLVVRSAGGFKLLDFRFEGIWLAKSWGDQFASIVSQNGGRFQALNDHLKQQLATGSRDIR